MIEFEKWQKNREIKTIGYVNNTEAVKSGCQQGWKAALEWVLKQLDHSSEHKEIEDKIYEELQE